MLALACLLAPTLAGAQQVAPRAEDAELPEPGRVWVRAAPVFQAWHQEFGPGPGGGDRVPMADDWSGPLLEKIAPGPEVILEAVNRDAGALGFQPLDGNDASLGTLEMREVAAETRSLAFRLEAGLPWGLAVDAMVPLVRTEVEHFGSFDPADATLAPATALFDAPATFFGQVSSARSDLRTRLESGQLSDEEADRARRLLEQSGAFADALQGRVEDGGLIPVAGTSAGGQLLSHYGDLRDGFDSFGLSLPMLSLPDEAGEALLGLLPADPLSSSVRGWLAGEPEFGLRLQLHDGFAPPEKREGLEARTAVGVRIRLPFRSANSTPFVQPDDLIGLPLGDGQRDLEVSLYQDLRWNEAVTLDATVRFGVQRAEAVTTRVRPPGRPLAPTGTTRRVEWDPGDYLRLRLAPRVVLNRFFSVGGEYRLWHKGRDRFRVLEGGDDASALELETEQTRHRTGLGAFYRPNPTESEDSSGLSPELGLIWQTAVAGAGGEVPAANLVSLHLRIPFHVF